MLSMIQSYIFLRGHNYSSHTNFAWNYHCWCLNETLLKLHFTRTNSLWLLPKSTMPRTWSWISSTTSISLEDGISRRFIRILENRANWWSFYYAGCTLHKMGNHSLFLPEGSCGRRQNVWGHGSVANYLLCMQKVSQSDVSR